MKKLILIILLLISVPVIGQIQPFSYSKSVVTMYCDSANQSLLLKGTGQVRINWGDGIITDTVLTTSEKTIAHTYSSVGRYYIKFYGVNNFTQFKFSGDYKLRIQLSEIRKFKKLTSLYLVGTTQSNNLVYGDLNSLPTGLTYLYLSSLGTNIIGSISSLPTGLTILQLESLGTNITGSISSLPTGLTYLFLNNLGTNLTGSINSLPTGLTYLYLRNLGTNITGNLSSLPTGLTILYLNSLGNSIDITTGTMKAWAGTTITIFPQTSYGYTTAQIDGFLNAWASVAGTGTKTIDLRGANQPRSSASDVAVTTLQGLGKTILTN